MRMEPRKLLDDTAMGKVFVSPVQEQTLLLSVTSHILIWAALPVSIRGLAGVQHWGIGSWEALILEANLARNAQ